MWQPSRIMKLCSCASFRTSRRRWTDAVIPVGLHPYYRCMSRQWQCSAVKKARTGMVYSALGFALLDGQLSSVRRRSSEDIPSESVATSEAMSVNGTTKSTQRRFTDYITVLRLKNRDSTSTVEYHQHASVQQTCYDSTHKMASRRTPSRRDQASALISA